MGCYYVSMLYVQASCIEFLLNTRVVHFPLCRGVSHHCKMVAKYERPNLLNMAFWWTFMLVRLFEMSFICMI